MKLTKLLKVDKNVQKINDYIIEQLTNKGLYDESLDIQILVVAGQIFEFNKMLSAYIDSTAMVENNVRGGGTSIKKNPLVNDLQNLAESIRKGLKSLSLNFDSTVKGVSESDPLKSMIDNINGIDDEG